jgi:hypothetical protein
MEENKKMNTIAGSIKERLKTAFEDETREMFDGICQKYYKCKTKGCDTTLAYYSESYIVGGYCFKHRSTIPKHIPLEQHGRYLDRIIAMKGGR